MIQTKKFAVNENFRKLIIRQLVAVEGRAMTTLRKFVVVERFQVLETWQNPGDAVAKLMINRSIPALMED